MIVIVGGLVLAKLTGKGDDATRQRRRQVDAATLSAAVLADVTSVPAGDVATQVGAAGVTTAPSSIKAPALTADGKPEVLYIGAEYCPFCAAERWPVVVALSRFGTWSGLGATTSSAEDVFPNTPTLSFHGAKFTSDYADVPGYETQTNKQSTAVHAARHGAGRPTRRSSTPTTSRRTSSSAGGIPFINIGGKYVTSGASFSPELLAGKTRAQIAAALATRPATIGRRSSPTPTCSPRRSARRPATSRPTCARRPGSRPVPRRCAKAKK